MNEEKLNEIAKPRNQEARRRIEKRLGLSREQTIEREALNLAITVSSDTRIRENVYNTLLEMAKYADEHPKNPWRDASKELPEKDKRFDNHDTLKGCSKYVLTLSKDGDIVIARYNTITKMWCNFKTYITKPDCWMPIPKLKGE